MEKLISQRRQTALECGSYAADLSHPWYCLQTFPGKEEMCGIFLEYQKFNWYGAEERKPLARPKRGGPRHTWRCLFPGYIFVTFDLADVNQWNRLIFTRGIKMLFRRLDGYPAAMPQPAMEIINSHLETVNKEVFKIRPMPRLFQAGDEVEILDGPMARFKALVTGTEDQRVEVLISIFGRPTLFELDRQHIRHVAHKG